jgi:hypothetical protein
MHTFCAFFANLPASSALTFIYWKYKTNAAMTNYRHHAAVINYFFLYFIKYI